ncbi:hypothetical protein ONQ97_27895, partial [Salmonella enterica subsp. enterica serovar Virginia]|nr:hypothetical protein [Salmonella enterica subsp. enterica serovar Virginia]
GERTIRRHDNGVNPYFSIIRGIQTIRRRAGQGDDPIGAIGAAIYDAEPGSNLTASGEMFDPMQLTAAHPTLPIPSYARITNL